MTLKNIIRIGFGGWIVFELLNWFNILHFELDFTWLGLVLTSSFVWITMEIVSAKLQKSTGRGLPWYAYGIVLLGTTFDALGDVAHWYSKFEWYDQIGHFNGGAMATLVFFFVLYRMVQADKIRIGPKLLGFLALCGGTLLGVLYEMEEYIEDVFTGGNRLGDGVDTANDLLLNTLGALFIVLIAVKIISCSHAESERSKDEESS